MKIQESKEIGVSHGIGLAERKEGGVGILKRQSTLSLRARVCAKSPPFK